MSSPSSFPLSPRVSARTVCGCLLLLAALCPMRLLAELPVTRGLVLHLDASSLDGFEEGEFVAEWLDLSGENHHARALWSGAPAYLPHAINGHPALRFDGRDDYYEVGDVTREAHPLTAFVVSAGTETDGVAWQRLLSSWEGGSEAEWEAPNWNLGRPWDGQGNPLPYDPQILTVSRSNASIQGLMIGTGSHYNGHLLDGDIAEVLIYHRSLSGSETSNVRYYLQEKYGLPALEPGVPAIEIMQPTFLSPTTAVLRARLNSIGSEPAAVAAFWGTQDCLSYPGCWENQTEAGPGPIDTPGVIAVPITGLSPDTTYHYRFWAINSAGVTWTSQTATFDTSIPRLSAEDLQVVEGDRTPSEALVRITSSKSWSTSVSFTYETLDGSALSGIDYTHHAGEATIPGGEESISIAVPLIPNTEAQPSRSFQLQITNPQGAIVSKSIAVCTIIDDDRKAYFVAPDGSDEGTGAIDSPFATLERARNELRHRIALGSLPNGGVTVFLRGGTYPRNSSFVLNEDDSGREGSPVVYRAAPGEKVTVLGGTALERDWFQPLTDPAILSRIVEAEARPEILVADLFAHGLTDLGVLSRHGFGWADQRRETPPMTLHLNSRRMTLARWPNDGTVSWDEILDPGPSQGDQAYWEGGGTFSYAFDRPQYWQAADDIWLDGIFGYPWEWSYNKVASIDPAEKTITLRYGEVEGLQDRWGEEFFFAENLFEEIDLPGEYFIDRNAGKLYFYPPPEFFEPGARLWVSTAREPLVDMTGVSHVHFRDLTFDTGRTTGIRSVRGRHLLFQNLAIRNFAEQGMEVQQATSSRVSYCEISEVGGHALVLNGGNKALLTPGDNAVENTHIHDLSWYSRAYRAAVQLDGVANRIAHCLIHDTTHPGILLRGNNHTIEYNDISRTSLTFQDMGSIYMNLGFWPYERGSVIRRNYFHHYDAGGTHRSAVYPDIQTFDLTIEENVFFQGGNQSHSRAIHNNTGAYILSRNNLFVDCLETYLMGTWGGFHHYPEDTLPIWERVVPRDEPIPEPHASHYPEMNSFWEEERQYPTTNDLACNLVVGGGEYKDDRGILNVSDLLLFEGDPGFRDPGNGDFALEPDSPVYEQLPCFSPIPFDQIGIRPSIPKANADLYYWDPERVLEVPAPGVLANDDDAESDPLQAVLVSDVSQGQLFLDPSGAFTYSPPDQQSGPVTFEYKAVDKDGESTPATVTLLTNAGIIAWTLH